MQNKKCAIYARVSKSDESQDPMNQLKPLRSWAESLGLEVEQEYVDFVSGGNSNRPRFQQMLADAKKNQFNTILVWSLDRFSREGISNTLHYLEDLKRNGVALKSLQEGWLDTSDESMGQLLLAIFSWVAAQERTRISERTKAGLLKARENGKTLGRPNGAKDSKKRKRSGYWQRWQKAGILV